MVKIALIAGGEVSAFEPNCDLYIGVDRGSLFLLNQGLPLALAVGDFDSVSEEERSRIEKQAGKVISAQAEKDDTDLELALESTFSLYPQAQVRIFGALGGRLDHQLANVFLASSNALAPFMKQISLVDKDNYVCYFPAGKHAIAPKVGFSYLAFMPVDGGRLEISGAKYPLNSDNYFVKSVYTSNEFVGQPISFSLDKGYVVVIYSRDRS